MLFDALSWHIECLPKYALTANTELVEIVWSRGELSEQCSFNGAVGSVKLIVAFYLLSVQVLVLVFFLDLWILLFTFSSKPRILLLVATGPQTFVYHKLRLYRLSRDPGSGRRLVPQGDKILMSTGVAWWIVFLTSLELCFTLCYVTLVLVL